MKMFEWDDLRIFLAVLRGRSVRAASRLLNVSHSTISRRLQAMEQQTGVKFFIRRPEGFVLTKTGEALVARAERVESEIFSIEREIFGRDALLSGPVRISAPPPVAHGLLMPILSNFSKLYPDIEIDLDATFDVADLRRSSADIAIRFQVEPDPGLIAHRLPDFQNAIYASPDYIANHSFSGPEPNAQWIALGGREVLAHWRNESPFAACRVHHTVSDMSSHVSAVREGLGFAWLFCFLADADTGLMNVPDAGHKRAITAWALTHPDLDATIRVRVCVQYLVEAIKKLEDKICGF